LSDFFWAFLLLLFDRVRMCVNLYTERKVGKVRPAEVRVQVQLGLAGKKIDLMILERKVLPNILTTNLP